MQYCLKGIWLQNCRAQLLTHIPPVQIGLSQRNFPRCPKLHKKHLPLAFTHPSGQEERQGSSQRMDSLTNWIKKAARIDLCLFFVHLLDTQPTASLSSPELVLFPVEFIAELTSDMRLKQWFKVNLMTLRTQHLAPRRWPNLIQGQEEK